MLAIIKMRSIISFVLIVSCLSVFGQHRSLINKKDTILYLPYQNGLATFSFDGKMGVIDSSGKVIVPASFDRLNRLFDAEGEFSYRFYYNKKQMGILNKNYKVIIPVGTYDDIDILIGGYFKVKKDGKFSFIDTTGKRISNWFSDAGFYRLGLANVKINGNWGYIDTSGKIKIKPIYAKCDMYSENGLASFTIDNKNWGFIDTRGEERIAPKYEEIRGFWNGLCEVKNRGLWGYIDSSGKTIIPFEYKRVDRFDNFGMACVKQKGKYIFIDKSNNQIIKDRYYKASGFSDNSANTMVKTRMFGRWIWINRKGECVNSCK